MGRKHKIVTDLEIIDIGHKGMSIAKNPEGQIHLLKGGVPGDTVTAVIRRKKKGLPFGDVQEITTPSVDRVNSFCDHFALCGGCKWQDLSYERQLHQKQKQVHDALVRLAGESSYEQMDIIGCERTREYRNKLEFTFSPRRWLSEEEVQSEVNFADRRGLGFHLAGAYDRVLDIDTCHLMPGIVNDLRNEVRELAKKLEISFYDVNTHMGILRNLMIRHTRFGQTMVVLIVSADMPDVVNRLFEPLRDKYPQVTSWQYIINEKLNDSLQGLESTLHFGESHITEQLGNKRFLISPLSFFQTNSWQAERLYNQVKDYAELTGDEVVYDLYCGTGSIGIYLGDHCASVIGVEENPDAVADAKLNATQNGIDHAEFYVGDVQDIVDAEFTQKHGIPDVLITDPPRAGMSKEVVEFIQQIGAPKIVYVSCNPGTMARDIKLMQERYDLKSCTPVDMFPHTSHIESVALLVAKS